jgi:exonuclease SbcC
MEITLKNFRHHRNANFTIPDSGMVMIKGKRGTGKSTILSAIFFALYGKVRRPLSHKSKTCTVELNDKKLGIFISRTRTPNKLTVKYKNKTYEESAAQGVIDTIMKMECSAFHISSYFDQRKQSSIFSMNPAEQLEFVSTIASFTDDYEETKETSKKNTKMLLKLHNKFESQFELINSQINEKEKELKTKIVSFPKDFNPNTIKKENDVLSRKNEENLGILQKKRKELSKLTILNEEVKRAEKERFKLETEHNLLTKRKNELPQLSDNIQAELEDLREKILDTKTLIKQISDFAESERLLKEYNETLKNYNDTLLKEIKSCENKLITEEKLSEKKLLLSTYEEKKGEYIRKVEEFEKIESERKRSLTITARIRSDLMEKYDIKKMGNTATDVKNNIQKRILINRENFQETDKSFSLYKYEVKVCPECKCNLQMKEDGLLHSFIADRKKKSKSEKEKLENIMKENNEEYVLLQGQLKEILECLELNKLKIPKFPEDLEIASMSSFQEMCNFVKEQENLSIKIKELEHNLKNIPTSITKLLTQSKDKKKGIPSKLDKKYSVEDLSTKVKQYETSLSMMEKNRAEHNKLAREISNIEKSLSMGKTKYSESEKNVNTVELLNKEIQELESESLKISDKFQKMKEDLKLVEIHEKMEHFKLDIKKLIEAKETLENEIQSLRNRIEGSEGLETSAKEAEFIALARTLNDINQHAKIYLKQIFTEENITAELSIKSHTKKGNIASKPSIEVRVEKNGELYDDIDDLSGGERQLCDLAFLLGVNDMLGSKIIMLDECFNNLDAETNLTVLQFIKNLCKNKRVIVISHEAVEGVFDEIVSLS